MKDESAKRKRAAVYKRLSSEEQARKVIALKLRRRRL